MKTIVILRGVPGSGKSHYAKNNFPGLFHIEADMFFESDEGYVYDRGQIGDAHAWCRDVAELTMKRGVSLVVANTFTTMKEIQPYLDIAETYGYTVRVLRLLGNFKSVHNVPDDVITKMRNRFQDIDGELFVVRR